MPKCCLEARVAGLECLTAIVQKRDNYRCDFGLFTVIVQNVTEKCGGDMQGLPCVTRLVISVRRSSFEGDDAEP